MARMIEVLLRQNNISVERVLRLDYKWLLSGIVLFQWLLFRSYVLREIAWGYPTHFDQSHYLLTSYRHFETLLQTGFLDGLSSLLFSPNSNGVLLHIQTVILFLLFGASRLSALSVNFLNFVLYLVVFVLVLRHLTVSRAISLLGAGLLLGVATYFFWGGGGLMDYRLDFSAFCFFGIFISLVIRSGIFISKKWSIMAGLLAGMLILTRFITMIYIAGIYAVIFIYFILHKLRSRNGQETYTRLKNAMLSGMSAIVVAAPFLWINRVPIYTYYIVGGLGPDRFIRAKEQGVNNLLDSLWFYPNSIVKDHFGLDLFFVCLVIILLGIGVAYGANGKNNFALTVHRPFLFRDVYFFLASCLLIVLSLLTANPSKSPIIGGILVPVLLWGVVLTFIFLIRRLIGINNQGVKVAFTLMACLSITYGGYNQVANLGKHGQFAYYRPDVETIKQMYETIGNHSQRMDWSTPAISTDSLRDYLLPQSISVRYYESHGVLIHFQARLGGVFSLTNDDILKYLADSDFVILTHKHDSIESPFPFYESIEEARPLIEKFARDHLVHLEQYRIYNRDVDLYARPSFRISSGISGDWITSDGIVISLPFPVAAAASEIVLSGPLNSWISPDTTVSCSLLDESKKEVKKLAVEYITTLEQYSIHCYLPESFDGQESEEVQIGLNFSNYFVPKELGMNEDTRQLVVVAPTQKFVVLKSSLAK